MKSISEQHALFEAGLMWRMICSWQIWKLAVLYFVEEDKAGDIFEVCTRNSQKPKILY